MIEERIKELGYDLPELKDPIYDFVPAVVHGDVVYLSGHLPFIEGKLQVKGKLGDTVTLEEGYEASRICVINLLASLKKAIGSLDKVERILKVTGFVNSASGFTSQPDVINAASKLLLEIFGEKGKHARSAVGAAVMPRNTPVEIEMIVAIKK